MSAIVHCTGEQNTGQQLYRRAEHMPTIELESRTHVNNCTGEQNNHAFCIKY